MKYNFVNKEELIKKFNSALFFQVYKEDPLMHVTNTESSLFQRLYLMTLKFIQNVISNKNIIRTTVKEWF